MVKLKFIILVLAFTIAGMEENVAKAEASTMTIGFDVGSPPFFDLKNGCPIGIYPLIVGAIFHDAGQPIIGYPAPFRRVLANVDAGVWGAGGILKTPERVVKYDFTEPIYTEKILFYFNKKKTHGINSIADLEGKRVGVVHGWSYGYKIDELITNKYFSIESVNSDLINFKKLQLGRIDVLITIQDVGFNIVSRGGFNDLAISGITVLSNDTYIAFKKNSNNEILLKRLNSSIKNLNNTGQISNLVKKYLQNPEATWSNKNFDQHRKALIGHPGNLDCYLIGNFISDIIAN